MLREDVIRVLGGVWGQMTNLLASSLGTDVRLLDSVNASVLSHSGKQLRPMMALLSASCAGTVTEDAIKVAVAAEMLHNASLMHDDVADESSLRRGCPTVSSMIGPRSAVLVGDFWLARSVDLLISTRERDRIMPCFSKTLSDLSEGEMLQLEKASSGDTSEKDYLRIIYCKTASLFEAACRSGVIASGASPVMEEAAVKYAGATGIAFQIKDDILDYIGGQIGKPIGNDLKEKKITLPLIGAMLGGGDPDAVRKMVMDIDSKPGNLEKVRNMVIDGGGIDYAKSRLSYYVGEAVDALSAFPESESREMLATIAHYNSVREV